MISVYEALQGKSDNLLKGDEYRNESGVICCKKCHAPRQIMLPVEGKLIYPRVLCLCQREERDRLEAERKARIQREEIQRNRSAGIPDLSTHAPILWCQMKPTDCDPETEQSSLTAATLTARCSLAPSLPPISK